MVAWYVVGVHDFESVGTIEEEGYFFFQAEDGIRDRSPSRGLGDVYKGQRLRMAVMRLLFGRGFSLRCLRQPTAILI